MLLRQGFPIRICFTHAIGTGFSPFRHNKKSRLSGIFLLLRQGSNLNFSDPESDVLPITPRSNNEGCKYKKKSIMSCKSCKSCKTCKTCKTARLFLHLRPGIPERNGPVTSKMRTRGGGVYNKK